MKATARQRIKDYMDVVYISCGLTALSYILGLSMVRMLYLIIIYISFMAIRHALFKSRYHYYFASFRFNGKEVGRGYIKSKNRLAATGLEHAIAKQINTEAILLHYEEVSQLEYEINNDEMTENHK